MGTLIAQTKLSHFKDANKMLCCLYLLKEAASASKTKSKRTSGKSGSGSPSKKSSGPVRQTIKPEGSSSTSVVLFRSHTEDTALVSGKKPNAKWTPPDVLS